MRSEYAIFNFEENLKELIPIIDRLLGTMRENMDGRMLHDYVNMMIVRNDLLNVRSFYRAAIPMSTLVIGSQENAKHKIIVQCTEPFFMQFKDTLIDMCSIKKDCNFNIDLCNKIATEIEHLIENVYELFDTMGCWKIFEEQEEQYEEK